MTKDEALKLALEYIETNAHERRHVRWAIKEALAQPEKKPEQLGYVPLSDDEMSVFIDGFGVIPLAYPPVHANPLLPEQERYFCPRCGKRTADPTTIHTCTAPRE